MAINTIIYRGVLEGARVRFLADAFTAAFGESDFYWVAGVKNWARSQSPEDNHVVRSNVEFLRTLPNIRNVETIRGRNISGVTAHLGIRRSVVAGGNVLAIGHSSLSFARAARPGTMIWAVNGIPEERSFRQTGLRSKLVNAVQWRVAKTGKSPDLCVTVSTRMNEFVRQKTGWDIGYVASPTCSQIPDSTPGLPKPDRKYFTYAGSGAPWQNLESLNLLWKEISKINPDQQFMVISRDPRSRSLGDGLPKEKVRFESVVGPEPVGELLQEAQLGFATRQPSLINQVSYPTKIGEYLAAGVPVVTSDIDWDPGDLLRDESVGLLLSPGVSEEAAAKDVQEFYEQTSGNSERTADACASIASKISYDTLLADLTNQFSRLSSKA